MANYVNTSVTFHKINDQGKKVLEELYSRVRKDNKHEWFSDIFVDGQEGSPTYEESEKYDFTLDEIGPKWCYFQDFEEDFFNTVSAWSWPETGVEWIFDKVASVDPDFVAYVTYEDEMPNFIGACVYDKDGLVDALEDESDEIRNEIRDYMLEEVEGLVDEWNEDEQEFTDEGDEIFNENMWEWISDRQMQFVHEVLDGMDEDEQEKNLVVM